MKMNLFNYLRSVASSESSDSSKSFSLVVSVLVGAAVGLTVCVCLLVDVWSNGHIITDLDSLGLFLLCVGGYMAGGGLNKALSIREERKDKKEL